MFKLKTTLITASLILSANVGFAAQVVCIVVAQENCPGTVYKCSDFGSAYCTQGLIDPLIWYCQNEQHETMKEGRMNLVSNFRDANPGELGSTSKQAIGSNTCVSERQCQTQCELIAFNGQQAYFCKSGTQAWTPVGTSYVVYSGVGVCYGQGCCCCED